MTRKAIVAAVGDSWIELLSLDETERAHDEKCGGGSCGSNGHTGCGCRVSGRPFRAEVPRKLKLRTGDTVEVTASSSRALAASLAVFGIPLALTLGTVFTLLNLFPDMSDAAVTGIAAGSLALGTAVVVVLGGRKKTRKLPVVTAVIRDHREAG